MAGLVSNATGQWLKDNVGRVQVGPGTGNHNYSAIPLPQPLHIRVLPKDDPDYADKAEIYLPSGVYTIVWVQENHKAVNLVYGPQAGLLPWRYTSAGLAYEAGKAWHRLRLQDGDRLVLLASTSVLSWYYTLAVIPNAEPIMFEELPVSPPWSHVIPIAYRNDGKLEQYHEGVLLLQSPLYPRIERSSNVETVDPDAPDQIDASKLVWDEFGVYEQREGEVHVEVHTPVTVSFLTRTAYDRGEDSDSDATHNLYGYQRLVTIAGDGRIISIGPESRYVIDATTVYPSPGEGSST